MSNSINGFFCLLQLTIIGLASVLVYFVSQAHQLSQIDLSSLSQVSNDWSVRPFVEIQGRNTPCSGEWETVFWRMWSGMEEGCIRDGRFSRPYVQTRDEYMTDFRADDAHYSSKRNGYHN